MIRVLLLRLSVGRLNFGIPFKLHHRHMAANLAPSRARPNIILYPLTKFVTIASIVVCLPKKNLRVELNFFLVVGSKLGGVT